MNIYVVVENQFPDTQLVMICACHDEEQAITAYERLWLPQESRISGCILVAECNRTEPAVLWKNFITEYDKTTENGNSEENQSKESTTTEEDNSSGKIDRVEATDNYLPASEGEDDRVPKDQG